MRETGKRQDIITQPEPKGLRLRLGWVGMGLRLGWSSADLYHAGVLPLHNGLEGLFVFIKIKYHLAQGLSARLVNLLL